MNVPQFINPKISTKATTTSPLRVTHGDEDVANHFSNWILRGEMTKRNPRKAKNRNDAPRNRNGSAKSGDFDTWLYGLHAVTAALENPKRQAKRLMATRAGAERLGATLTQPLKPEIVDRETLEALLPQAAVHQGIALNVLPLAPQSLESCIESAESAACIVVLDQVTDPQNVGAVMRSAAAFGAIAVVLQDRHAPPVTGALAKAASGAVETLPLLRVTNLSRALEVLKSTGFWCVGLDGDATSTLADLKLEGRICLVMGAEDSGLRRLTAENCDALARLPTSRSFGTLNVSAASAAALYETARLRKT